MQAASAWEEIRVAQSASLVSSCRETLTSSLLVSSFPFIAAGVGLPGSETPSLSEILGLLPVWLLLPLC